MSWLLTLVTLEARRVARRPWVQVGVAAGAALAVVAVVVAATHEGLAREDALRRGTASLLLLGGLALAIALGSAALNRDATGGHFGMLLGGGASRPQVIAGAVGARLVILVGALAAWTVIVQAGALALGLGLDGPLAVHALAVGEGLVLALLACAAASAIVAPAAAGVFGASVYVVAQAAVNLKAAADQGLIGTADAGVSFLYWISPRAVTSPMIADMQFRDVAGPAAPRVEINQNTVIVPAAEWDTVVWTLAWCVLLALVCVTGLRRRPVN
ncbi:hypothetical protein [Miltoncostaea oceani]|uniref:hypothetical protein n=1 Tax=Miltoncostaea oceani TaxID=2843216 RepID=UPI001C3E0526|nr:hypothetical protein [Miltoncostaea oceani]